MNTELDYLNKCIKFIEDTPPSKFNAGVILKMKVGFLPRLKAYLEGVEVFVKDSETLPDQVELAEKIFNDETKTEVE